METPEIVETWRPWSALPGESARTARGYEFRSSPWLDPDVMIVDHRRRFVAVRETMTGAARHYVDFVAAQHLPPEHRAVIAEAIGAADVPDWLWVRLLETEETGHRMTVPPADLWCCLDRTLERHRVEIHPGLIYWASRCESPDGLHGCGKVWWTRREPVIDRRATHDATLTAALRMADSIAGGSLDREGP